MPCCAAINCTNRPRKDCRLFKFPTDPDRRNKWIINTRRVSWTPGYSTYLCEKHFENTQFEQNRADNWRKLKPNAIPTLFDISNQPSRIGPPSKKLLCKNSNQTVETHSPRSSTRIREAVVKGMPFECEIDAEQNRSPNDSLEATAAGILIEIRNGSLENQFHRSSSITQRTLEEENRFLLEELQRAKTTIQFLSHDLSRLEVENRELREKLKQRLKDA